MAIVPESKNLAKTRKNFEMTYMLAWKLATKQKR